MAAFGGGDAVPTAGELPVNTGTPLRRETPAIPPSPGGGTPSAVGYGLC